MPKASTSGGRRHIPLPHPPPMASKAGHARLHHRILLLHLSEHPPHENPGYAPDVDGKICIVIFEGMLILYTPIIMISYVFSHVAAIGTKLKDVTIDQEKMETDDKEVSPSKEREKKRKRKRKKIVDGMNTVTGIYH